MRRITSLLLALVFVICCSSCAFFGNDYDDLSRKELNGGRAVVQFLNVGQADCSLIQLPDGRNILIDAGNEDDGSKIVQYLNQLGIETIDYLVGTHPHEDHIGGLDDILINFSVKNLILPKIAPNDISGTVCYENVLLAADALDLTVIRAVQGATIIDDSDVRLACLSPGKDDYSGLNDYSAVLMFSYGKTNILFTGDAENEAESNMLETKQNLDADILKVGHHGSETASSKAFLEKVTPEYAVISCGKDNSYGHPHEAALKRLNKTDATVLRTDLVGSVIFYLDKSKVVNYTTSETINLDGN